MSLFPCTDINYDLFGHLDLPKCHQIMFVNKYYYEFYQVYKSMILKNKTRLASQIIKERIEKYGFNYDEFIQVITENQGVIAGFFPYLAIQKAFNRDYNFDNCNFNDNVIDVYAYTSKLDSFHIDLKNYLNGSTMYYLSQIWNSFWFYKHPIEMYIEQLSDTTTKENDYQETFFKWLTKDIIYVRVYHCFGNKVQINFTLVNKPMREYVFENLDIDCCKIIHTKNDTVVYNIDNFITLKCNAHIDKIDDIDFCRLEHLLSRPPFNRILRHACYYAFYDDLKFGSTKCNYIYCIENLSIIESYYPCIRDIMQDYGYVTLTKRDLSLALMIKTIGRIQEFRKLGMLTINLIKEEWNF